MALNADILLDRIRLKQQMNRWRIIAIIIAALALLLSFEKGSRYSPIKSDYIARITISDIITDDPDLTKLIKQTEEDSHAKAVLVWLDTPGGSAVGGQQLYLDLLALSKTKPVVAVMRSMATSAGYMAALGTNHLIAREGSITGSIGVILEAFEATGLAEKVGIHPITVKSGPYKASPNPLEKYTREQNEVLQAIIDDFFDWFVGIVAERRHLPVETVRTLADGRIYTGRQALKSKLIDELGGEEEALDWIKKTYKINKTLEVKDVKIEKETPGVWEQLTQIANGKIGARLLQRLDGLQSIWQPNSL
jgi:protease IV